MLSSETQAASRPSMNRVKQQHKSCVQASIMKPKGCQPANTATAKLFIVNRSEIAPVKPIEEQDRRKLQNFQLDMRADQ